MLCDDILLLTWFLVLFFIIEVYSKMRTGIGSSSLRFFVLLATPRQWGEAGANH